ncbi:hypothetical protein M153_3930006449 [Pseudoloma neurophilia]|uniref:Uncharacterized protein n=1 Tax=Pseudoloma neurophilia TaxID=146866 RepID=A0A0R0LXN1_9MICR|nr:hypothetical protein M153_3930006449 [Pseudoloma neurophilia]
MLQFHTETLKRLVQFKQSNDETVGLDILVLYLDSETYFTCGSLYDSIYSFKNSAISKKETLASLRRQIKENFILKRYFLVNDEIREDNMTYSILEKQSNKNDLFLITLKDDSLINKLFSGNEIPELLSTQRKNAIFKHFTKNTTKKNSVSKNNTSIETRTGNTSLAITEKFTQEETKSVETLSLPGIVQTPSEERTSNENALSIDFPVNPQSSDKINNLETTLNPFENTAAGQLFFLNPVRMNLQVLVG